MIQLLLVMNFRSNALIATTLSFTPNTFDITAPQDIQSYIYHVIHHHYKIVVINYLCPNTAPKAILSRHLCFDDLMQVSYSYNQKPKALVTL